jgi:hypothetical protein
MQQVPLRPLLGDLPVPIGLGHRIEDQEKAFMKRENLRHATELKSGHQGEPGDPGTATARPDFPNTGFHAETGPLPVRQVGSGASQPIRRNIRRIE